MLLTNIIINTVFTVTTVFILILFIINWFCEIVVITEKLSIKLFVSL